MSVATNVVRRPGSASYYVRIRIPKDLQEAIGKEERWVSLRTPDARKAKALAPTVLHRWQMEFEDIRRRRMATVHDLARAGWEHYVSELERDAVARANLPSEGDIERERVEALGAIKIIPDDAPYSGLRALDAALEFVAARSAAKDDQQRREILKQEVKKHLASGQTVLVEWAADLFIEREKLLIERDSSEYKALCQRLLRAQLEALERATERDLGNWGGTPRDPVVKPAEGGNAPKLAPPGETIMDLFERFKRERFGSAKADTWDQAKKTIELFADFVGPASHISTVTRKAVREWKTHLLRYPRRASDTNAFKRLGFKATVEANSAVGKPPLSDMTVNRFLSALSKFCDWLRNNEFLDSNPVDGHHLEIDKRRRKVKPHTIDQLIAIFSSPLFNGCAGDKKEHVAGDIKIRDWRYWLPAIALYTGARLGEIAQLFVDDIREQNGVCFFT